MRRWLVLPLVVACGENPPPLPTCKGDVSIKVVVPTETTITADFAVHGSLLVADTITALGVSVGAATEGQGDGIVLPIAAKADAVGANPFLAWEATVPLGVLLAPITSVPNKVVIVAAPILNCATEATDMSKAITVDLPPDAGIADAPVD